MKHTEFLYSDDTIYHTGKQPREVVGSSYFFAHLSDPHLTSLQEVNASELLSKRILGYLSWRKHRREEHRPEILEALLRDLHAIKPDHTVITGDLTHLGLPREFQHAQQWLTRLGEHSQVSIVPGNHDAYVHSAWNETFALWFGYMCSDTDDAAKSAAQTLFPSLRVRGPLAIIGACSALPSPPLFATGRLGRAQLRALDQVLDETHRQGLFRILLIHHPPIPGVVGWRKRLTDSAALRDIVRRRGVEMILHGHSHRSSIQFFESAHGRVPVVGVPSASAIGMRPGRRAQYHLYRLRRNGLNWEVEIIVRGYDPEQGSFVALGSQVQGLERVLAKVAC